LLDIDDFSRTLSLIYDSSLDPGRWNEGLSSLAGLFHSPKAQISYYSSLADGYPFFEFSGFTRAELEPRLVRYRELALTDPRMPPALFKAFHCRQIVSDDKLHASAIYQDVLAPAGIEYAMYFGLDLEGEAKCALSVMRGQQQSPFTDEDCQDFSRFIPHVIRAVTMHGSLRRAHENAAAAAQLVDSLPIGMIVLNGDEIALANAAARTLLEEGLALWGLNGRLRAVSVSGNEILQQALAKARGGGGEPVGFELPEGGGHVIRAVVRRLQSSSAALLGARDKALALYLSDSRRSVEAPEEVLQRIFGLTTREAGVLRALVHGDDMKSIAQQLGMGAETLKTHVRHILQATGVSRRAELIRLVLTSPAWIAAAGTDGVKPPAKRRGRAAQGPASPKRGMRE
jgi:DNA-binding CsgD family transcriptional regulator